MLDLVFSTINSWCYQHNYDLNHDSIQPDIFDTILLCNFSRNASLCSQRPQPIPSTQPSIAMLRNFSKLVILLESTFFWNTWLLGCQAHIVFCHSESHKQTLKADMTRNGALINNLTITKMQMITSTSPYAMVTISPLSFLYPRIATLYLSVNMNSRSFFSL